MTEPLAVAGIRRTMRELVDGTIRVVVDIEPPQRADFLRLLPEVDMPVALAPLNLNTPPARTASEEPDSEEEGHPEPPARNPAPAKGGPLSRDAAIICSTEEFKRFLGVRTEDAAAVHVRDYCAIKSRAELDHNPNAASRFSLLMFNFRAFRDGKGPRA